MPASTDAVLLSQSFYGINNNNNAAIPNTTRDNSFTIQTLGFDTGADVFSIDANASGIVTAQTLTLTGGTNALGGTDQIVLSATTTGTISLGANAGRGVLTIALSGTTAAVNVANSAATLIFGTNATVTGSASLTKSGSGTLLFSGANTYTGTTTVSAGTLAITGVINTPNSGFVVSGSAGSGASATLSGTGAQLSTSSLSLGNSNGTGNFLQTGGSNSINGGQLNIGILAATSGTYTLNGGTLSTPTAFIGNSGTGSFVQNGGINTLNSQLRLGSQPGSIGSYSLSNGTLSVPTTIIGNSGIGSFLQSGGTNTVSTQVFLGNSSGGNGTYNLSAGTLSTLTINIGVSGTGNFVQTGGTNIVTSLFVGRSVAGNGTYTLSGSGTLQVNNITRGALSSGTFNLNGGILQARASTTHFMEQLTTANIQANGAVVDTNNFNISIAQQLVHDASLGATGDGGLTKTGTGTLTLTGSNTFNGSTTVLGGTLEAASAGALGSTASVTVNNGNALRLSGSGNRVKDSAPVGLTNATITVADTVSSGSETLGALTLSGSSTVDFGIGFGNTLTFAGLSSFAGTLTVNHWTGTAYLLGATNDPSADATQDRFIFSTDPGFAVGAVIPAISFYDDAGNFIGNGQKVNNNGPFEIVAAVPEPSPAVLAALGVASLACWHRRNKARRATAS